MTKQATKPPLICPVCGRRANIDDGGRQVKGYRSVRWLAQCGNDRSLHVIVAYGATEAAMRKRWPK